MRYTITSLLHFTLLWMHCVDNAWDVLQKMKNAEGQSLGG